LTEKLRLFKPRFKQEIQVGDLETEFSNFTNYWDNVRNALDANTNEFGEVLNVDEPEFFREETSAQPETKKSNARAA
jgi:chemotaxis methyl-accepting protein methylase